MGREDEREVVEVEPAQVIGFAIARPRRMTLNEILIRPTAQSR
jgi:NADP-dependent 3-hydroxy acid dehydrogenase YdfG